MRYTAIGRAETDLDIPSAAVEIKMQVFYFTKIGKAVLEILFGRLFVYICYQNDPSLDG